MNFIKYATIASALIGSFFLGSQYQKSATKKQEFYVQLHATKDSSTLELVHKSGLKKHISYIEGPLGPQFSVGSAVDQCTTMSYIPLTDMNQASRIVFDQYAKLYGYTQTK